MRATVLSCPVSDQVHKSSVSIHWENDLRIAVFILPSVPVALQQRIASKWDDDTTLLGNLSDTIHLNDFCRMFPQGLGQR